MLSVFRKICARVLEDLVMKFIEIIPSEDCVFWEVFDVLQNRGLLRVNYVRN